MLRHLVVVVGKDAPPTVQILRNYISMGTLPKPPKTYTQFIKRFPHLGKAWESINEAGGSGPLDERTQRLIKLAVAIGAMREGAVHSSVRKGLAMGIQEEEIDQVVALAAGVLGMPSTVAVWSWVGDIIESEGDER